MAITGIIGIGFVVVHMIGNLKAYLGVITEGDERVYDIDIYGEFLRELLVPILPRDVRAVGAPIRADRRSPPAHPRRVLADRAQPQGAPGQVPERRATTRSPTSPAARCAGPASSWCCSSCGTSPTSPGAGPTPTSCVAPPTATRRLALAAPGGDPLHRRQHRARDPPLPRHLVAVPVDGVEQPPLQQVARSLAAGVATIIVVGNVSFPIAVLAGVIEYDPDAVTVTHEEAAE